MAIDVSWMFLDGAGGARDGKRTLHIPGALPGERVQVRAPDKKKGFVNATLEEVEHTAPERQVPACPHHARCGGCDLAHAQPDARRRWLAEAAATALKLDTLPVVPSPRIDARARVKVALDGPRVGYRSARSHDIVDIAQCGIARPEVNDGVQRLRTVPLHGLAACEVRSNGERVVFSFQSVKRRDVDIDALRALGDVALDGRIVSGDPTLWIDNGVVSLRASPLAFYQVNLDVNREIVAYVRRQFSEPQTVVDLYSGNGNLGLALAKDGHTVHAVESVSPAIDDLRAGAKRNDVTITAEVSDADAYDPSRNFAHAVVLDPPRRGCAAVIKRLAQARTPTIVLVSCNPRAASRDVQPLRDAGYDIVDACAFDLFPDTHHLEVATTWRRVG